MGTCTLCPRGVCHVLSRCNASDNWDTRVLWFGGAIRYALFVCEQPLSLVHLVPCCASKSNPRVLLVPEGLVTSYRGVTLSDIWCEEHRASVVGLFLLLLLEASYLLLHSHTGANVSLNYGFVIIFHSTGGKLSCLNRGFIEFLLCWALRRLFSTASSDGVVVATVGSHLVPFGTEDCYTIYFERPHGVTRLWFGCS